MHETRESNSVQTSDPTLDRPANGLYWWERALAIVIGLCTATSGVFAVFLTQNQAGSGALVVVGSVFLLVGLQGTALRRADQSSIELEKRERVEIIVEKAGRRMDDEGAFQALEFIEGAKAGSPTISNVPQILALEEVVREAQNYNRDVKNALARNAGGLYVEDWSSSGGIDLDFRLVDRDGKEHYGVLLFFVPPAHEAKLDRLYRIVDRARRRTSPTIVVTNSSEVARLAVGSRPVPVVAWSRYSDDPVLERTLSRKQVAEDNPSAPSVRSSSENDGEE